MLEIKMPRIVAKSYENINYFFLVFTARRHATAVYHMCRSHHHHHHYHHHHLFAIRSMIYKTLDISSITGQQGIQMHQQLPVNKCRPTCPVRH